MGKFIDLTGQKFGKLTVIEKHGKHKNGSILWVCECSCNKKSKVVVPTNSLKNGNTKGCGCEKGKQHGLSRTRIYREYNNMRYRCYKSYSTEYQLYNSRGITVCNEWLDQENGFINFYNWAMANGYRDDLTLDRINNNKGYYPTNCRWATWEEQENNKSNNHLITFNNQTHNIAEWVKITGIPRHTLVKRLNSGWDIEKALTKPVDIRYRHKNS